MRACIPDGECKVFEVMFVEPYGAALIFGIEHEDGRPRGVKVEVAERQKLFIGFLRDQNEIRYLSRRKLGGIFMAQNTRAKPGQQQHT